MRERINRLFSKAETERANHLLMVLETIELSFSQALAGELYFIIVAKRIGSRRQKRMVMSSAFFTTLMTLRKLDEFFLPRKNGRSDDVKAVDFGFSCQPALTKTQREELNKYAAHLTSKAKDLGMRGFPFGVLGAAIYSRCFEFFDYLESKCLDRRVTVDRQMLAQMKRIRHFVYCSGIIPHPANIKLHPPSQFDGS